MRLIDADEVFCSDCEEKDQCENVVCDVKSMPTIDPESLRPTAEWIDLYGGKFDNPRYACSNCEGKALYTMAYDLLGNSKAVQVLSDSCPHCGAKMKGAREDA